MSKLIAQDDKQSKQNNQFKLQIYEEKKERTYEAEL